MGDDHGGSPIDHTAPTYVYVQVADHIAARIASGRLRPGARLPGERDLADEYGVSAGTARRVVRELRARGLAVTVQYKGTFIQAPAADDAPDDESGDSPGG